MPAARRRRASNGYWKTYNATEAERYSYRIRRRVAGRKTAHQRVEILDTEAFGRALFLDGVPQSAEADEFVYHEGLVHPVLVAHPRPQRVLILGGGEGATLREVLRHASVERAVMVDLDGELVELCRKHLACMHQGAFDDPRVELLIEDAVRYLERSREQFDVIIVDVTDPTDRGAAAEIFRSPFHALARTSLSHGGALAMQAGPAGRDTRWLDATCAMLSDAFSIVRPYTLSVPFFYDSWSFVAASDLQDAAAISALEVSERLGQRGVSGLKFYDAQTHVGLFALPLHLRTALGLPHASPSIGH